MIERSTLMKEVAKTEIQDKLIAEREMLSLREKLKSKDNKRLRARTCAGTFYAISKVHIRKGTWLLPTH